MIMLMMIVDSPLHIVALAQTYNDTKQFQLTIYFHKEDYKMLGSSLSKKYADQRSKVKYGAPRRYNYKLVH